MSDFELKKYEPLPTMRLFHESPAQFRCIVGPVGSGKTSAATVEVCYYLPMFLYARYNIKRTRWCIARNTTVELLDTTQRTVFEWFPDGRYAAQKKEYYISYENGVLVELLFRACDRPEDVKKFKSLEITGYWIDESIEVKEAIKLMLANRIGRYPPRCPVKFGIETTNPPDVEHPTYSNYAWHVPPPGPIPPKKPLKNHAGFWQPPYENAVNLNPDYYKDLESRYADYPEWRAMYVQGKPGMIPKGKLVYNNFERQYHVAKEPLAWMQNQLYRGWDNSGNCPACVVLQIPDTGNYQVLAEFYTDRMGIVDFTRYVVEECSKRFQGAKYVDYGDPAGESQYSTRDGGFTSNAQLMREECGVDPIPADQNFTARKEAVEQQLRRRDGLLIDPSCQRLINGFIGGYVYPEIGTTGIYRDAPLKNKFSHVHDALQYVCVSLNHNLSEDDRDEHGRQQFADADYDEFGG